MKMQLLDGSLFCSDHLFPVILGLLGAALLGWLLKHFMGGSSSTNNTELQTKYDRLAADFHEQRERYNKLSADKKKKTNNTENIAMGASVATGTIALATHTNEVETLNNKLKNLKLELATANENSLKLQADVNAANTRAKQATTLNSEVETLKVRVEGLSKALEISKADAEKYKIDFDNANGERSRLSAQLANSDIGEMQNKINRLENTLDTSRIAVANLQSENERLKNGVKTVGAVMATSMPADNSTSLKEAKEELEKLQLANAKMAKEIETANLKTNVAVNEATAKANKEITELRGKIKMAEGNIAKLENDVINAKQFAATAIVEKTVVPEPAIMATPIVEKVIEPTPAPVVEKVIEHTPIVEAVVEKTEQPIAAPIVEEAAKPSAVIPEETDKSDLTIIEGIGPKIAEILNAGGIHNFTQLASASVEHLKEMLHHGGERFNLANPSTWAEQAALLRDGKMAEFRRLCDELNGGVRESDTEA